MAFEKKLKSPKGTRKSHSRYCVSLGLQKGRWLTSGIPSFPGMIHEQASMPGLPADIAASWIAFSMHRRHALTVSILLTQSALPDSSLCVR